MKIFDLHSDYPTAEQCANKSFHPHSVVHAFWTSELSYPLYYIKNYIIANPVTASRLYAIEDLGFVESQAQLDSVCALPLTYASLTWNFKNSLAGGANSDGNLTDWGRHVVATLIKNNIAIDTAHLNQKSFSELIVFVQNLNYASKKTQAKILNSHTCLSSNYAHNRNLSHMQIEKIHSMRGIVALTPVGMFMRNDYQNATRADFVHQIYTYCQRYGDSQLAIGTDFYGAPKIMGLECYDDFLLLADDLYKLGYKKDSIDKIFYKNAYNFYLQEKK